MAFGKNQKIYAIASGILILFLLTITISQISEKGLAAFPVALIECGFLILLTAIFYQGEPTWDKNLTQKVAQNRKLGLYLASAVVWIPYLFYIFAVGYFSWRALGSLLVLIYLPVLLIYYFPAQTQRLNGLDFLVLLLLWIPFDHRYLRVVWAGKVELHYLFNSLTLVALLPLLFGKIRGLKDLGFTLVPRKTDWLWAVVFLLTFMLLAVPIGLLTGFLSLHGAADHSWLRLLARFLGIFFTIAAVEELAFRGVLQNFLQKTFSKKWVALVTASVLFGLTHWNNGVHHWDWRYLLLASVAGLFYGGLYLKTRRLFASIFMHTLVDFLWALFL